MTTTTVFYKGLSDYLTITQIGDTLIRFWAPSEQVWICVQRAYLTGREVAKAPPQIQAQLLAIIDGETKKRVSDDKLRSL